MTPSERERRRQHRQLHRARWKLDAHQVLVETREGDGQQHGERDWRELVERRIQQAMADGAFDNLPGAGKPLKLSRNPYLDPSLELAYGLLQNNGYAPEWITRDKEIREELETARARLRAAWAQRQANQADETGWGVAVARFEEVLAQLNRKIDDLNLMVPVPSCQRVRLRLTDELRRLNYE